jgi:hypothetical protein
VVPAAAVVLRALFVGLLVGRQHLTAQAASDRGPLLTSDGADIVCGPSQPSTPEDRMKLHGLYPPPSDEFFQRCPGCQSDRRVYEQDAEQGVVHMEYECGTERWFANGMRWRCSQSEQCRLNNPGLRFYDDGWTSSGSMSSEWNWSRWPLSGWTMS